MHTRPEPNDPRTRLLAELPVSERRLELAGISTAVLEGGAGEPVVLLHGLGEYAAKWLRVIPSLVTTHRVIAPDLPGHGTSEVTDSSLDADRVLDWLAELIERTCATPPVLLGQTIGGAIAARFAAERKRPLRSLVLADSLGLGPFQPAPEFGRALSAFVEQPNEHTYDGLWRRCAFDLDRLRMQLGDSWERLKAYSLDRTRAPGMAAAQHRLMEQFGLAAIPASDLARITVPTTLIWGRHDLATQLGVAQSASIRYGWPLYVIDGAADDPAMEQPDAFLDVLRLAAGAQETRQSWDRLARGYDDFVTPTHIELANEGLKRVGLAPGMRFLDVACGSGALGLAAARLGAQVTAVDLSPVMLERIAARARSEGLTLEARVMDGHALAFADDTFDVAGSQWGVMLFPDFARGLRELVRVTKAGGRVLLHAFGPPAQVEFFAFFAAALGAAVPDFQGIPMEPLPLPFQVSDPEKLRREFVRAGLRHVEVETVTESLHFASGRALWDWLVNSNPIPNTMVSGLSRQQVGAVIDKLEVAVRERAGGASSATLTNPVHIAIGTK